MLSPRAALRLAVPLAGCGGGSKSDKPAASYRDRVARARKLSEDYDRAKELIRIGYQQARARDTVGAEETLEPLEELVHLIDQSLLHAMLAEMLPDLIDGSKNLGLDHVAERYREAAEPIIAAAEMTVAEQAELQRRLASTCRAMR